MLADYLKNNVIITDGAMGTYYSQISDKKLPFPELANLEDLKTVELIHSEYIKAGAKLIRTNTFSANPVTLNCSREKIRTILCNAYKAAVNAAFEKDIFIAANIGPIPETPDGNNKNEVFEEYRFIADIFLELGADIFNFETFSSTEQLKEITHYIRNKKKSAFIIVQFAVTLDGYTRKGIGKERIINEVKNTCSANAYGFNCGVGPTHLFNMVKDITFADDILSMLPNAGYPEIINERTVFSHNPEYFAEIMANAKGLGIKILGGCCGTTPMHIKALSERLNSVGFGYGANKPVKIPAQVKSQKIKNTFAEKMKSGKFLVAVELDPPFNASVEKIINGANLLKENGVDLITLADSPMARPRVESTALAAKIKREVGIEVMPHICCRDKNINAIKSALLAAHMEDIRNILAVTGDPIPNEFKNEIKSVFNLNSIELIELISEMNMEVFEKDSYNVGAALNLNVLNKEAELLRMQRKIEKGAKLFLTQPIFENDAIECLAQISKLEDIKLLGGIMPVVSYKNAQFLNNEIPGIKIPGMYIERFKDIADRAQAENTGVEIAVEIANSIRPYVDGYYFITPFNRVDMIIKIINKCM
ncbi:MAG: bifunctional homocysteine S-methyltransferase/methylenetetrahydrofolate reductase [Bacillota bacterium]|nr:bifunctional homocysteine S-methyltransferase/methylenetetrahydrofolate reductase [Bacillota bacterium]